MVATVQKLEDEKRAAEYVIAASRASRHKRTGGIRLRVRMTPEGEYRIAVKRGLGHTISATGALNMLEVPASRQQVFAKKQ